MMIPHVTHMIALHLLTGNHALEDILWIVLNNAQLPGGVNDGFFSTPSKSLPDLSNVEEVTIPWRKRCSPCLDEVLIVHGLPSEVSEEPWDVLLHVVRVKQRAGGRKGISIWAISAKEISLHSGTIVRIVKVELFVLDLRRVNSGPDRDVSGFVRVWRFGYDLVPVSLTDWPRRKPPTRFVLFDLQPGPCPGSRPSPRKVFAGRLCAHLEVLARPATSKADIRSVMIVTGSGDKQTGSVVVPAVSLVVQGK